jgi:hypothetical protein
MFYLYLHDFFENAFKVGGRFTHFEKGVEKHAQLQQ